MHYHLILTEKCDSKCKYCYEKSLEEFDNGLEKKFKFDFSAPCVTKIDTDKLADFLKKDSNPVLIFYGGEPLLQTEKIIEIIDKLEPKVPNIKFRMQTNAKLLNKLPIKYLNKITKILVSIDGNKERTDQNRGEGTFDLVIKNLKQARAEGYKGEIVARMTIAQDCPDLYEQVQEILKLSLFDSVHWQIDAGFYKFDFEKDKEKIKSFFEQYNKSISKLVNFWTEQIRKGNVLKLYPFIGILNRLLGFDKETKVACGAGHTGYAITTDGKVVACPIMNSIENFKAGDLNSNPNKLKKFEINECDNCEVKDICGGRCLYWRKAKLWPTEGDEIICNSIRYLINELEKSLSKIEFSISEGKISQGDFEYEKYFGPEIIP